MSWITVGKLAKQTGTTVRTLHHYDEIGLLTPNHRTDAGYRMYGPQEILKLSQIICLRQLGVSLEEIQAILSAPGISLADTLEEHARKLQTQIQRQQRLLTQLQTVAQQLRADTTPSLASLGPLMEAMNMLEKYYTQEQMDQLSQRSEEVGEERIQQVQQEWQELFALFQEAYDKGLDPASDEVQALARRSHALIQEFTGGDPAIMSSLQTMYQQEGGDKVLQPHGYGVSPDVFAYMHQAQAAAKQE